MQETAVENPYCLGSLIQNGNIVSRSILAVLLIMSLLTWFIMITKFFDQRKTRLQAISAEKEFWNSSSLTDAISKLKGSSNPFRALAETGKQAFEYHEINKGRLSGAIGTSEWITESLQRTADTVPRPGPHQPRRLVPPVAPPPPRHVHQQHPFAPPVSRLVRRHRALRRTA